MKTIAASCLAISLSAASAAAQEGVVRPLLSKDLVGVPGKELAMIVVEYPPGGADPAHTHDSQVMVYVIEGSIVMQVAGMPPVTLKAGGTFYEAPDDVHAVSRNASSTEHARFVVFFVKRKGAPTLVPTK